MTDYRLIGELHDSSLLGVISLTGGGSLALSSLLTTPGASRTVLEAVIPYSGKSLRNFLGGQPDQSCSAKTARAMAMAAYMRSLSLADEPSRLFGLGCTAALATDRHRRGQDRAFLCIQTLSQTSEFELSLDPQRIDPSRNRQQQEQWLESFILSALGAIAGLEAHPSAPRSIDTVNKRTTGGEVEWQALLTGKQPSTRHNDQEIKALFPGAFNPFHEGHRHMIQIAESRLNVPVTLEISAFNVDKPPLDYYDIRCRTDQLADNYPFVLTHAPTFLEKSAIFPGVPFIVGLDTIERIAQQRYYQNDDRLMQEAINTLCNRGNSFLVFGRAVDGSFRTLDDIKLPDNLRAICDGITETEFREDISSTAIRQSESV